MLSPEVISAIVGLISSTVIATISLLGARKFGIGSSQIQLIGTLKDITSAQDTRIDQLEKEKAEISTLLSVERENTKALSATVVQQAREIAMLREGKP